MSTHRFSPLISILFLLISSTAFAQAIEVTRTAQNTTDNEQFGTKLAVDGPWMAAYAPGRTRSNVVDLYKEDAQTRTWIFDVAAPLPRGTASSDKCGTSLALHKERLLVGCPGFNRGNGIVYAFWRHPAEGWIHVNTLKPPTTATGFGSHVSLSKDTAALIGSETKLYHCVTKNTSQTPRDENCREQTLPTRYTKLSAVASDGNFAIIAGTITDNGSGEKGGATLFEFRSNMPDVPWRATMATLDSARPFQSADISHRGNNNPLVILASEGAPLKIYEISGANKDMPIEHSIEGDQVGVSKGTRVALAGNRAIIGSPLLKTSVLLGQNGKQWQPIYQQTKNTADYAKDVAIFGDTFYVSSPNAKVGLKTAGNVWTQKLLSFTYTYNKEIAPNNVVYGIGPNGAEYIVTLKDGNDNLIDEALFRGSDHGLWRFPINAFSVLPAGKYILTIEDKNASTPPITRDVAVGGTSAVSITAPSYAEHMNKQRVNANGECGANNQKMLITLKRLSDTQGNTVNVPCNPNWRLSPNSDLPEGTYLIFAMPEQKPEQTVATKFTIDVTAPVLNLNEAPDNVATIWAIDANKQFTGQCTDNGNPCNKAPYKVTVGEITQDLTMEEDGTFTFGLPQGLASNMQHALVVSITDRAGNTTEASYTIEVSGEQINAPRITSPSVDGHQFFSINEIAFGFTATPGVSTTVTLEEFDGNDENDQPTFKGVDKGIEEIDGDQTDWFWTNSIDWEAGIYRITLETPGATNTASRIFSLVGEFDFQLNGESSTTNNLPIPSDVVLTGNVDCESCLVDVLLNDEESQYTTTTNESGDWSIELTGLASTIDEIDVEIYQPFGSTAYLVALSEVDVVVTDGSTPVGNPPEKLETGLCGTTTLPHGHNPLPMLLMLLGGVFVMCRRRLR